MKWVGMTAGLLILGVLGGFGWFVAETRRTPPTLLPEADGIVALTGGAERVETALWLLANGRGHVLLVSGVGGSADLAALGRTAGFPPDQLSGLREKVTLGRAASSTHGNAIETADWARAHALASLIVVTAAYHMPRALAELSRALPDVALRPVPVRPAAPGAHWRLLAGEYAKFLAVEAGL